MQKNLIDYIPNVPTKTLELWSGDNPYMKIPINKIASLFFILCSLIGCSNFNNSAHDDYYQARMRQQETIITGCTKYQDYLKKQYDEESIQIAQRLSEIEKAYTEQKINTAEYLSLKNNLIQESKNDTINFERDLERVTDQCKSDLHR